MHDGPPPFVTRDDGVTLHELVGSERERNEANLWNNRDGECHNVTWDCGVGVRSTDPAVRGLHDRRQRNKKATLFVSQGVPMVSLGDELTRTQLENNKTYSQVPTSAGRRPTNESRSRTSPAGQSTDARARVLRGRRFSLGRRIRGAGVKDIVWLVPDGQEASESEWNADNVTCIGVRLAGDATEEADEDDAPIVRAAPLYLLNVASTSIAFTPPSFAEHPHWEDILDTFDRSREGPVFEGG